MGTRREWTEAEVVVLCAIFVTLGFAAGDDERPECRKIAAVLQRSRGTIDRQWRNVKDYLANLECKKVGDSVKYWAEVALMNPAVIKKLAAYYCHTYGWALTDLLEKEDGTSENS